MRPRGRRWPNGYTATNGQDHMDKYQDRMAGTQVQEIQRCALKIILT